MSENKYPYVPKKYYPAVILACKMIRESGWFNKAVSYCANKYNLDEDTLAHHIRKRQAAGQKGKKRTNPRKVTDENNVNWINISSDPIYSDRYVARYRGYRFYKYVYMHGTYSDSMWPAGFELTIKSPEGEELFKQEYGDREYEKLNQKVKSFIKELKNKEEHNA